MCSLSPWERVRVRASRCSLDVAEADESVAALGGKFAEDAGVVDWTLFAPDLAALFDPLGGGQAGDDDLTGLDVGAFEGGYGDGAVDAALLVEGATEGSAHGGGIADEEQEGAN